MASTGAEGRPLPDLLAPDLVVVFCGTGAGPESAKRGHYYAGPGNRFWRTLAETGLTDRLLAPAEDALVLGFGIGLTDVVKDHTGVDRDLGFHSAQPRALRERIGRYAPRILCFNGKRAAHEALGVGRRAYGLQPERWGSTELFVAPSTSAAARRWWDLAPWWEVADRARASGDGVT